MADIARFTLAEKIGDNPIPDCHVILTTAMFIQKKNCAWRGDLFLDPFVVNTNFYKGAFLQSNKHQSVK